MKRRLQPVLVLLIVASFLFGANNTLSFDGSNDYVQTTSSSIPAGGNTYTVECWFYLDEQKAAYQNLVSQWTSDNSANSFFLGFNGYNSIDNLRFSDNWNDIDIGTWETNQWHHIAAVSTADNAYIYFDGILKATRGSALTYTGTAPVVMGRQGELNAEYFGGKIDEVRIWNSVRTETEIRQNMYRELPNPASESNLVAYYKFNETYSATTADSKGSNTGTLQNMTGEEFVTSAAIFGPKNCLEFDGLNDHVKVATLSSTFTQGTISFWIKPKATPSNHARVFSDHWDDDEIYLFSGAGNVATWHMINGDELMSSSPLPNNAWTHVAITMDNLESKLYINGILDDESGPSDTEFSSTIEIGGYSTSGNPEVVNGYLDEFRIWNDVRSQSEIREYMFKTLTGNEDNLLAYYCFDNTTGTTLQDFSGNGNDGVLTNMTNDDWVVSSAFNTWLNTSSSSWSTAGNWSSGSVPSLTDNVGIYSYTGGTNAILSGSPTLNNLLLGGSASMSLSSALAINGNLVLESGLDLNGQTITLGSNATLLEGSGLLSGTSGNITTTRILNSINKNVAGLGAEITEDGNLGITTIIRGHTAQGDAGIKRYYQINSTNSPSNASLVFHYDDSELNGQTESELKLYKSSDGESWTEQSSTVNTTNNTLTMTGINSFSWWTAAPSGSEGALPIELSTFTADIQNGQVVLFWQTASETNNAVFLVYRNDEVIARIEGAGTTSETNNYVYTDAKVVPGVAYTYVLADVDYANNETKYENDAVTVTLANDVSEADFKIGAAYPNPFNPTAIIPVELSRDAVVEAKVYTLTGREIATLANGSMNAGSHELRISAENLTTGLYLVKIVVEDVIDVQKIAFVK